MGNLTSGFWEGAGASLFVQVVWSIAAVIGTQIRQRKILTPISEFSLQLLQLFTTLSLASMLIWGYTSLIDPLQNYMQIWKISFIILLSFSWLSVLSKLYLQRSVGVVRIFKSADSGISYFNQLKLARTDFKFLGIGAYKLTIASDDNNEREQQQDEFTKMLRRCADAQKKVTLLLWGPTSADKLAKYSKVDKDSYDVYAGKVRQSLEYIRKINSNQHNIEVKFYNPEIFEPSFRIMLLNDNLCLVSYMVYGKSDGTNIPQILLSKSKNQSQSSFFYPFDQHIRKIEKESVTWDFKTVPF